jgi:signal transduction histidine kinase
VAQRLDPQNSQRTQILAELYAASGHGRIEEAAAKHAELLRAEQQKEELTSLIVHDLKSPAAGIVMAATSRLGTSGLPASERRLWNLVYTSAEVINRMALNLLDIASSTDGVLTPHRKPVAVDMLLQDVERLMTPVAEGLEHPIALDVAPALPPLHADPELMRRVLQNLVDNALRHSPRGEGVSIEADTDGLALEFRVKDRGPGIPRALRDRVFDKYMRIGTATEGSAVGKGLGLAFCRLAVDAHGGTIHVDDNPPRGSVFTVRIPLGES